MRTKRNLLIAAALLLLLGSGYFIYKSAVRVPALASGDIPDLRGRQQAASGGAQLGKPADAVPGMEGVAANGKLSLYYDPATMAIAVRDAGGRLWYSNPPKAQEDAVANASVKDQLSSQLIVRYNNKTGQRGTKTSGQDSVQLKQAQAEPIPGGLKVTYTIGQATGGADALPKSMTAERFQSLILDKVGDKYKRYLDVGYQNGKNKDVYERNDKELTGLKLNKVLQAFQEAGYTAEDLAKDNEAGGGAAGDRLIFTVPVEYTLQEDQLAVRIPTAEIKYPASYPLTDVSLLPYFGAADLTEEGYMFVPDGSGSLIRLNNGKQRYEAYAQPVYGDDPGTWDGEEDDDPTLEPVRLPVYGMTRGDGAFLAIIDQGAAVATVNAEVSRMKSSYNSVFASFQLLAQERINLSATTTATDTKSKEIPVFQQRPVYSDFGVRYAFLSGDQASYTGMAAYYRGYLEKQGAIKKLSAESETPFYLETVGGISKRESLLGIPYRGLVPMTTFEQTESIVGELKAGGVGNVKLRLTGWFNGGIAHKPADSVKVDVKLGGSGGYKALADYASAQGVKLYPDVSFTNLYDTNSKYSASKTVARYVNRRASWVWENDDWARPLSPRILPHVVDGFLSSYERFGRTGISVRSMGTYLTGDYRRGHVVDRTQSEAIDAEQLAKIAGQLPDIMVDGGNAYTLPYAKDIVRAPMTSSGYNLTDESVPFYQIALHGYVNYAGAPLNLSQEADADRYVLQCLEYGANVYFAWIYGDNDAVKNTNFEYLYSVNYKTWMPKALEAYAKVNEALAAVQNQPITDHVELQDGVYRTTYGGGREITVNYNDADVLVDGAVIKAKGYAIKEGGGAA